MTNVYDGLQEFNPKWKYEEGSYTLRRKPGRKKGQPTLTHKKFAEWLLETHDIMVAPDAVTAVRAYYDEWANRPERAAEREQERRDRETLKELDRTVRAKARAGRNYAAAVKLWLKAEEQHNQ